MKEEIGIHTDPDVLLVLGVGLYEIISRLDYTGVREATKW